MFDWEEFLRQHGIEYEREGKSNLRAHCPWCSDPDSLRMSISVENRGWHCWANISHRGRSPVRLVAALARCSLPEAAALAGVRITLAEGYAERIHGLLKADKPVPLRVDLPLPPEFRPLDNTTTLGRPFADYLQRRGFAWARIPHFTDEYKVFYARQGRQRYRIVFAVHDAGRLVAWTGRSIAAAGRSAERRYLASDEGEPITDHLWQQDALRGDTIALCEGPFDSLKVCELGRKYGITSTCFFTAAPTDAQMSKLHTILPRFRRRLLLLDRGTLPSMLRVQRDMITHNLQIKMLRDNIKDPGELDSNSFADVFSLIH
jgi:hypothetical protein